MTHFAFVHRNRVQKFLHFINMTGQYDKVLPRTTNRIPIPEKHIR